ncbi:hypothetical protein F5X99DRAFT_393133 [Biscogniauxia marginata]|nr:hypothetical protein F5X99DRAFT_393133 [Biscogniauxia marginata]
MIYERDAAGDWLLERSVLLILFLFGGIEAFDLLDLPHLFSGTNILMQVCYTHQIGINGAFKGGCRAVGVCRRTLENQEIEQHSTTQHNTTRPTNKEANN